MNPSLRTGLVAAALAAAALATWYWSRPHPPAEVEAPPVTVPAGYYLRDALLLGTGEDGQVLYEVEAEHVEEQPAESRLLLRSVQVEYRPDAQVPWQVRAARAEAPIDGSFLLLGGGVELVRDPEEGKEGTVIQAESLRLAPEEFVASTSDSVTVVLGNERLRAVGVTAYLKDDRLELESEVHGQFAP